MKITIADVSWESDTIERALLAKIPGAEIQYFSLKTEEELIRFCQGSKAILSEMAPFSRKVLAALPGLELISAPAIGVDHIDLDACRDLGIAVANVPGYCSDEVADHAMALLLAINRAIVLGHERVMQKNYSYVGLPAFPKLRGQTMGIIGCGAIGCNLAHKAAAFGMEIIGYHPRRSAEDLAAVGIRKVELAELMAKSDVISLHLPANEETAGFMNKDLFALSKKQPILINTGRGKLINEADLASALNAGLIAWAGLDVLAAEPPDWGNPLLHCPNVIFTPHYGFFSLSSGREVRERGAMNIVNHFAGKQEEISYIVGRG